MSACDGKVALVTGTSRGLGKAIAQRLAAEGATVALTARTMEPDPKYQGSLRQTLEEIEQPGGSAIAVPADLSKAEDRERLFAEVVEKIGAPDILVNNAAVTFLRPLDEFPDRRVRLMMEMHVMAPLHLTQLAIPAMRERRRGWVLNVTSVGGDLPDGPPFSEFDRDGGLRHLRHGQGRAESVDEKPCGRTVRRRNRRQRRGAVQPGRHQGAGALDLAKTDTEDIALITQTAFVLCTGDPKTLTGRIAHTQPFLREIGWLSEGSARRVPAHHAAAGPVCARALDSGRYHSIWLPDHMVSFWPDSIWTPEFTDLATVSPSPHRHLDAMAVAAAAAVLTENVPLVTSVVDTVRRHPALLAQSALTIDHLAKGRFILGLGSGETENTVPYGFDFTKPVSRFEEALEGHPAALGQRRSGRLRRPVLSPAPCPPRHRAVSRARPPRSGSGRAGRGHWRSSDATPTAGGPPARGIPTTTPKSSPPYGLRRSGPAAIRWPSRRATSRCA